LNRCRYMTNSFSFRCVALFRACGRKGQDHWGPGPRNVKERERETGGREMADTGIQRTQFTKKPEGYKSELHGGCEMETCREHSGVPRNRCSHSSQEPENEERLWP
jgi:hypothetical protein